MQYTTTIKENRDFKRLYRSRFSAGRLVVCYAAKGRAGRTRVGITVGKKLGCAVKRNRCRRLLRAAYQELEKECFGCWDLVFVARAPSVFCKTQEVVLDLRRQFCRLGVIPKEIRHQDTPLSAVGGTQKANPFSFEEEAGDSGEESGSVTERGHSF